MKKKTPSGAAKPLSYQHTIKLQKYAWDKVCSKGGGKSFSLVAVVGIMLGVLFEREITFHKLYLHTRVLYGGGSYHLRFGGLLSNILVCYVEMF